MNVAGGFFLGGEGLFERYKGTGTLAAKSACSCSISPATGHEKEFIRKFRRLRSYRSEVEIFIVGWGGSACSQAIPV